MESTAAPAFKEWSAVVDALGAGEQILILRKGGIAEGRGGFQLKNDRFWLFPTAFHAQRERLKPSAARWFDETPAFEPGVLTLRYFAQIEAAKFITSWDDAAALDPWHSWNVDTVRERFEWSKPPGIHALVVRVYRLAEAQKLPLTPEMGGCKSWVTVPLAYDARPSSPVLSDEKFGALRRSLPFSLG